jgi:hypothetical protein
MAKNLGEAGELDFAGVAAIGEQPVDIMAHAVAAYFEAAMVVVDRHFSGDASGFGVGEEALDLVMQQRPVLFQ